MFINCHTYYSLRYDTMFTKELLKLAENLGASALCLTDINSTSACLDFIREASEFNFKPIVSVDFRNGAQQEFILLAQNNQGFENINTYLSNLLHQSNLIIPKRATNISKAFGSIVWINWYFFILFPFKIKKGSTHTGYYVPSTTICC